MTTKLTEGAVLTGISGEVEVQKGGAGEWTKYDQTVLKPGDEVRTLGNGKVTIKFPDGDWFILDPMSRFTILDADKGIFELSLGEIFGKIRAFLKGYKCKFEVRTPAACCCVRGTEFTVSVDEDGTTTVMVLEGLVEVQDIASKSAISLAARQGITLPKVPGGLTQQDMLGRVTAVWPDTIDRWWEEAPATTGRQPVPALSGVLLVITVVVTAAIIVGALVFALLMGRRHGRSPG